MLTLVQEFIIELGGDFVLLDGADLFDKLLHRCLYHFLALGDGAQAAIAGILVGVVGVPVDGGS